MKLTPELLISLLPVLLAVVGFAGAVVVGRVMAVRRLRRVVSAFEPGTARIVGWLAPAVTGVVGGYRFVYRIVPRSNNSPGGARATALVSAVPCRFRTTRMGIGGAVLLRLGLARDVEIGDPDLDRRLRFSTQEEMALRSVFGGESARAALRVLAATPRFQSLTVRQDRVEVRWSPRDPQQDDQPEAVRQRLMQVVELLAALGVAPGFSDR